MIYSILIYSVLCVCMCVQKNKIFLNICLLTLTAIQPVDPCEWRFPQLVTGVQQTQNKTGYCNPEVYMEILHHSAVVFRRKIPAHCAMGHHLKAVMTVYSEDVVQR